LGLSKIVAQRIFALLKAGIGIEVCTVGGANLFEEPIPEILESDKKRMSWRSLRGNATKDKSRTFKKRQHRDCLIEHRARVITISYQQQRLR
jgi:hypothetical protein